MIDLLNF